VETKLVALSAVLLFSSLLAVGDSCNDECLNQFFESGYCIYEEPCFPEDFTISDSSLLCPNWVDPSCCCVSSTTSSSTSTSTSTTSTTSTTSLFDECRDECLARGEVDGLCWDGDVCCEAEYGSITGWRCLSLGECEGRGGGVRPGLCGVCSDYCEADYSFIDGYNPSDYCDSGFERCCCLSTTTTSSTSTTSTTTTSTTSTTSTTTTTTTSTTSILDECIDACLAQGHLGGLCYEEDLCCEAEYGSITGWRCLSLGECEGRGGLVRPGPCVTCHGLCQPTHLNISRGSPNCEGVDARCCCLTTSTTSTTTTSSTSSTSSTSTTTLPSNCSMLCGNRSYPGGTCRSPADTVCCNMDFSFGWRTECVSSVGRCFDAGCRVEPNPCDYSCGDAFPYCGYACGPYFWQDTVDVSSETGMCSGGSQVPKYVCLFNETNMGGQPFCDDPDEHCCCYGEQFILPCLGGCLSDQVLMPVTIGENITIWEYSGGLVTGYTFPVSSILSPSGYVFGPTVDGEVYTVKSNGGLLEISSTQSPPEVGGNNIVTVVLSGVPGLDDLMARRVSSYEWNSLDFTASEATVCNAVDGDLSTYTKLGSGSTKLVLGFCVSDDVCLDGEVDIEFAFHPIDYTDIAVCTLWTNQSMGIWAPQTWTFTITNDSINFIDGGKFSKGSYLWNVKCKNNDSPPYERYIEKDENWTFSVCPILPQCDVVQHSPVGQISDLRPNISAIIHFDGAIPSFIDFELVLDPPNNNPFNVNRLGEFVHVSYKPVSDLSVGDHTVYVRAYTGSHIICEEEWDFTIQACRDVCIAYNYSDGQCMEECPGTVVTGGKVDLVFLIDQSTSMRNEWTSLCSVISDIESSLLAAEVDLDVYIYGLDSVGVSGSCKDANLYSCKFGGVTTNCNLHGSTPLSGYEDWGPGTTWLAENYVWRPQAARVMIPISDEGPHKGGGANESDCRGRDENCVMNSNDLQSIAEATEAANANNITVYPFWGDGHWEEYMEYVAQQMEALASATGGKAYYYSLSNITFDLTNIIRNESGMSFEEYCPDPLICCCLNETVNETNKTNCTILVYAPSEGFGQYNVSPVLEPHGFVIDYMIRDGTPNTEITDTLLSSYDGLWLINSFQTRYLTSSEIDRIVDFRENGGHLLLSVDNTPWHEFINPVSQRFGVRFYDQQLLTGQGGQGNWCPSYPRPGFTVYEPDFWDGVTAFSSSSTDGILNITNPQVTLVAEYDGHFGGAGGFGPYEAVLDEPGKGRIVFDSSFFRFAPSWATQNNCDGPTKNPLWLKNVAEWLCE